MSAPLNRGQAVSFELDGRPRIGTVETTWRDGQRAIVRTPEGEVLSIHAGQVDRPAPAIVVGVDLDEAERLAVALLGGAEPGGSVTANMLKLAAAVITLRGQAA